MGLNDRIHGVNSKLTKTMPNKLGPNKEGFGLRDPLASAHLGDYLVHG